MTEFFISPESEQAIGRELRRREQRFEQARQAATVNPQQGERLARAARLNPSASNELKNAYAVSAMTDETFQELSVRETERYPDPGEGGLMGRVGAALNKAGMGIWDQLVKPAVRGAFTVVDTAAQELLQRPITAAGAVAQGEAGSFREAYRDYGDSAGLNLLQGDLATTDEEGNPVEGGALGHGFFTGGQAQAQSQQERTLQINGEQANLGRAFANAIFDDKGLAAPITGGFSTPGERAYDLTAGVAQFAGDVVMDPTAWATMGATKALAASKGLSGVRTFGQARRGISIERANDAAQQLETYGLVAGAGRDTALLEQVKRVFGNTKMLEEMAGADAYTIMRRMKLDRIGARGDDLADLVVKLGDETDPTEIGRTLLDAAREGDVLERGFYKGAGRFIPNPKEAFRNMRLAEEGAFSNWAEFRYGGINPSRGVSASNRMQAATDIDGLLRVGKVGEADRAAIVTRALKTTDNDELLRVVDDTVRALGRKMEDVGVDPEDVEALLKAHRAEMNRTTAYLLDEVGRHSPPPWKQTKTTKVHGVDEELAVPSAALLSHLNKAVIPLPDPTDIRRATVKLSGLRTVYQSVGWEMTEHAARSANKWLFKFPTLFTRIAYPLRNNLDNQARAAGAGYHSLFTNPAAWFSLGVRNPHKFRDIVTDASNELATNRGVRFTSGGYGRIDEIADVDNPDAMARVTMFHRDGAPDEVVEMTVGQLREQAEAVAKDFNQVARGTGALTEDAAGMWADEGARKLGAYRTYTNGVDEGFIPAWRSQLGRFVNDGIAPLVADSARWTSRDELIDHIIDKGLVDELSKFGEDARQFFKGSGTAVNRQSVSEYIDYVEGHIGNLTNGDVGLRNLIATGDLNGVSFNDLANNNRVNQILREQYAETAAPRHVTGDTFATDGNRAKTEWKKATDWWVDLMASRPENRFTRFPLLAEVFGDDLARLMPSLSSDALRRQLVERAADAGFTGKHFSHIAQAAQDAAGQRGIVHSLDDVVDAAKLHSTSRMLDIAFDATQRSSFQEMADVVFPFWDAFAEVGTSWGRILRDNPAAFSRGTQALQSARGSGVIYTDENGQEVFAMPGGGVLANMLGLNGIKPLFEAPIEGLNLITQGFGPGFGPLVQWAAGAFVPDTPDWQWARDLVTPYGTSVEAPSDLTDLGGLLSDLTPAWIKKATNTFTDGSIDPVAWNSAVGDALKALATTGDYNPADPESQRKLIKDAEKAARWTTYLRAALQMGAPTGPGVTWEIKTDPDGTYHRINTMADAYYELLQASGDQTTATTAFIQTYGVEPFWIAQGKSRELREGPRTREGYTWIQRHGEAAERHPDVVGYFTPLEDPTAGDYSVYQARMAAGDIESLKPEEQLALANKTKARAIYYAYKDRIAELPSGQRRRLESQVRDALNESFPGWQADVLGVSGKLDRDEKIRLLSEAVKDPGLQDSPVTPPLTAYLQARDRAYAEIARRGGPTTLDAEANADLKTWLYDIGQNIVTRSPDFTGAWQTVLSSEVE